MKNEKELLDLAKSFGFQHILRWEKLPEEFIEKYIVHIDKYFLSKYQKLSSEFIEKHKHLLSPITISEFQNLSIDFIMNNRKYIRWEYFYINKNFSFDFKKEVMPNNDCSLGYCCWCDVRLKTSYFNTHSFRYCPICLR